MGANAADKTSFHLVLPCAAETRKLLSEPRFRASDRHRNMATPCR
jgi:hypothetical protein